MRWAEVSERLRADRANRSLSQRAYARLLRVSASQVARIEDGQAPTAAFLIAYGQRTGESIHALLFGSRHRWRWNLAAPAPRCGTSSADGEAAHPADRPGDR